MSSGIARPGHRLRHLDACKDCLTRIFNIQGGGSSARAGFTAGQSETHWDLRYRIQTYTNRWIQTCTSQKERTRTTIGGPNHKLQFASCVQNPGRFGLLRLLLRQAQVPGSPAKHHTTRYQPYPHQTIAVPSRDGFIHFHYGTACPTDHHADSPTTVSRWSGEKPKSALVQRHATRLRGCWSGLEVDVTQISEQTSFPLHPSIPRDDKDQGLSRNQRHTPATETNLLTTALLHTRPGLSTNSPN